MFFHDCLLLNPIKALSFVSAHPVFPLISTTGVLIGFLPYFLLVISPVIVSFSYIESLRLIQSGPETSSASLPLITYFPVLHLKCNLPNVLARLLPASNDFSIILWKERFPGGAA